MADTIQDSRGAGHRAEIKGRAPTFRYRFSDIAGWPTGDPSSIQPGLDRVAREPHGTEAGSSRLGPRGVDA